MHNRLDERRRGTARAAWAAAAALCAMLTAGAAWSQPPAKQPPPIHSYYLRGGQFQVDGTDVPPMKDGVHDPTDEAVQILAKPAKAMKGFPRDSQGLVDWVQALEKGYITPRKGLHGEAQMFPVDFDIIFTNTQSMPYVRFPHKQHTEWLTCGNCHPLIFIPQKGGNPITMSAIIQGQFCGVCHGKVAFAPTKNCGRCHSVPQEISVKR